MGLHVLGSFADRIGLGEELSAAVAWNGSGVPGHDRGKVLTHAMLMLAGGGECCADIEFLGSQERLFAAVCSYSTLYGTFTETLDAATVARTRQAVAGIRSRVWTRSASTAGTGPVILEVDASLVEVHSENKDGTAPHFKGGFGFHPVFCFADVTGEALAGTLRPGNATANDAADLLAVLDAGSLSCPPLSPPVTVSTTPALPAVGWWCAQIRRVARPRSWTAAGPATSASRSQHAAKARFQRPSSPPTATTNGGPGPRPNTAPPQRPTTEATRSPWSVMEISQMLWIGVG